MTTREAGQTAEEARLITFKKQADARLEKERASFAPPEASTHPAPPRARGDANDAGRARADAQAQTERTKLDAQRAAQRAADEAKALAERTKMDTELAAQRAARDKEAVEAANQLAKKTAAEQSEREKRELRNK